MDAKPTRDLQFVSLGTAATTACIRLTGSAPDPRNFERMQRVLNDMAHALMLLAPIYAIDPVTRLPTLLDEMLIRSGRFERGGKVLKLADGRTYGDLRIQRRDAENAVKILRGARIPWEKRSEELS